MKFAEKHCRKLNMGSVQYSPKLNLWQWWKMVWQLVVNRKQGQTIKAKYINQLACACQIKNPLGATLFQASCALQEASSHYLVLKPKHDLLHSDFLQSKLQDLSLSKEHHKAISQLISIEILCDSYCRICVIHQQSVGHSISAIEYPSPTGT